MRRLLIPTILAAMLAPACIHAQNLDDLPPYDDTHKQHGELKIWGYDMEVLRLWYTGFRKHYPKIRIWDCTHAGTAAAIGALYTGVADLGFMGRGAVPMETQAFHKVFGYDPLEIMVASGSYDGDDTAGAVVFVNAQNPVSKLTLQQVDGIMGSRRTGGWREGKWSAASARSAKENIRTWGQLGLTGEWTDKTIKVYGFDLTINGFAQAIQRTAFQGGTSWNPNLKEFPLSEPGLANAKPKAGAHQMLEELSADRYGIAYGGMKYGKGKPGIKPLALAAKEGGPYIEPTRENFISREYPIVEPVCIYINRVPGKPIDPKLKEFLRYILSREGQEIVKHDGAYLPLTANVVREQLKKLE